jgi:hypothetical protein
VEGEGIGTSTCFDSNDIITASEKVGDCQAGWKQIS